ncbi:hypothetical protein RN001_005610 [Aquatica leii]|uniref:DUF4806 domain-containing protein n=1 Tax=Aquatica leii TaxID=1421715 RepID=A0AAN7PK47_9COLE|nr:hypothetical protein RN001_005610 [Aquatica leii]
MHCSMKKKIVKSSESEDNIPSRYGRKIKTKKVTDYEEYLQPPSPTLSTASFSSDCRDIPNTRKCASEVQTAKIPVCSQQSVDRLSAINDLPTPPLVEKEMPGCSNQLVTFSYPINGSFISSNNPSTPPSVEENENLIMIDDIPVVTPCEHEPILNLLQEIKTLCQITLAKVNAFENSKFNNVTPICESVDKVTALLPLKCIDELLTFEEMIKTDPDVKSQLRTKLSFVGGSDFKNLIRRCLPKLLTDELAQQCSWTGQKNNFQVGNFCMMKIFTEAVSENFPFSKQREFELVVMEWLRFATQRLKRNIE